MSTRRHFATHCLLWLRSICQILTPSNPWGCNAERFYASLDRIRQDASSAVEYFGQYSRNTKVKLSNFSDQRLQMSTSMSLLRSFLGGGCIWLTNGDKTTCFLKAGVSRPTFSPQNDTGQSPTSWSMTRQRSRKIPRMEMDHFALNIFKTIMMNQKDGDHDHESDSPIASFLNCLLVFHPPRNKIFHLHRNKIFFHLKQNISL